MGGRAAERRGRRTGLWLGLRLLLWASLVTGLSGLSGCADPCEDLANRLCNRKGSDQAQCARWHERTSRVPDKTCEAGLRLLDRERVR